MSFVVTGNRVFVDPDDVDPAGEIYALPGSGSSPFVWGTVVYSPTRYYVGAAEVTSPLMKGDRVLVDLSGSDRVDIGGRALVVVSHEDVLGKERQ